MSGNWEGKRRAQENLILLVLGAAPDKDLSMLHLEKEVFLLWKFHPSIPKFIEFIAYQRGPYSEEIRDCIKDPYYLTDAWEYIGRGNENGLTGGYVRLTDEGLHLYQEQFKEMLAQEKMRSLLAGIQIVRSLYDELSAEELLLVIYDAYPEFRTNSEVAAEIYAKREAITAKLAKRGIVSDNITEYTREGNQQ